MVIAVVWSIAGGIALIVCAIGAMVKWNVHDSYDVRILEERNNAARIANERLALETQRERQLLELP